MLPGLQEWLQQRDARKRSPLAANMTGPRVASPTTATTATPVMTPPPLQLAPVAARPPPVSPPPAPTPSPVIPPPAQRPPPEAAPGVAQQSPDKLGPSPERRQTNTDGIMWPSIIAAIAQGASQHKTGKGFDPRYWQSLYQQRQGQADKEYEGKLAEMKIRAMGKGGRYGPERLQMMRERLELQKGREDRMKGSTAQRLAIQRDDRDPQSESSLRAVETVDRLRPELRGRFIGMSRQDILKNPAARAALQEELEVGRLERGGKEFNRREGVKHGYFQKEVEIRDTYQEEQERRQFALGEAKRGDDRAMKFAKDMQTDLDIAALVDDIKDTPGGVPPSFFERFRSSITARGIDPERMESWQSKHMVLEMWSRSQSGAAISHTEDGKFVSQVGLNMTASEDQVEAAYRVLSKVTRRRIRAAAAGNRESAARVIEAYEMDPGDFLGGIRKNQASQIQQESTSLGVTPGSGPKVGNVLNRRRKKDAALGVTYE